MDEEIICVCNEVTRGEIIEAIKNGADTVEKVGEETGAGTVSGACINTIQELIDENL